MRQATIETRIASAKVARLFDLAHELAAALGRGRDRLDIQQQYERAAARARRAQRLLFVGDGVRP